MRRGIPRSSPSQLPSATSACFEIPMIPRPSTPAMAVTGIRFRFRDNRCSFTQLSKLLRRVLSDGENSRCSCRVLMVPPTWADPTRSDNVGVRGALVLVVLDHGPDCREEFPRPLPRVRVRRDVPRRTEPLEDLLKRRPLLLLGEAIIELSDRFLEAGSSPHPLPSLGPQPCALLSPPFR